MPGKLGHSCKYPRCPAIVEDRDKRYCPSHQEHEVAETKAFSRKSKQRDPFYSSARWLKIRAMKLSRNPICELCNQRPATEVHHIISKNERPELALMLSNLQAVDKQCHARESQKQSTKMRKRPAE